jgi:hypothetical protein
MFHPDSVWRRGISAAPMQVGQYRGPQIGGGEPRRGYEVFENGETSRRSFAHLPRKRLLRTVLRLAASFLGIAFQEAATNRVLAELSHKLVVRYPKQPGGRVVRQAGRRPRLQRGHQGALNGVLDSLEVLHATAPRQ